MQVTAEISFKSKGIDRVSWTVSHGFYSSTDDSDSISVRAQLLLNFFAAVVCGKLLSFHHCHIHSPNRSKTKFTLGLWLWPPVWDDLRWGWMRLVHHTALWNVKLPYGWTAICSSVYFTEECQLDCGGGEAGLSSLSLGHRWPRHVCGSVKVRKLLSCQSTKIDEIWEVLGKGWRGTKGGSLLNHCGTCLADCTLNFQLDIFLVIWLSAYNTSSKSWESYILGIGCHVD